MIPSPQTDEVDNLIRAAFKVRARISAQKKTLFEQAGGKIVPDPYSKPPIVHKKTVDSSPEAAIEHLINLAKNGVGDCTCGNCRRDRSIVNRRLKEIRFELLLEQDKKTFADFFEHLSAHDSFVG